MSDAGARGGTRGGRDQFKWSDVKESADREYYLGHSVKATTGRWCKGRDVFWYAKARDDEDGGASAREELLREKAGKDEEVAEVAERYHRRGKEVKKDLRQAEAKLQKNKEEIVSAAGPEPTPPSHQGNAIARWGDVC